MERKIAKISYLAIVKTDKTNEYRQLRAKRETLEKALKALTDMAGAGGSVDERLKVQARLTEIEEKIQESRRFSWCFQRRERVLHR